MKNRQQGSVRRWRTLFSTCLVTAVLLLGLVSCHSSSHLSKSDYAELAKASQRLGMHIDYDDPHALFLEASRWVGVRYRYGGKSRSGVDCSGLVGCIYRNVYGVQLQPNSKMQYQRDLRQKVRKSHLKAGDLVFFSPKGSARSINHVGIYLKDGKFIHASTSRGVRVDPLDDSYWVRRWVSGGRVVSQ